MQFRVQTTRRVIKPAGLAGGKRLARGRESIGVHTGGMRARMNRPAEKLLKASEKFLIKGDKRVRFVGKYCINPQLMH